MQMEDELEEERRQFQEQRRAAGALRAAKNTQQRGTAGWIGRSDGRTAVRRKSIDSRQQASSAALAAHEKHLRQKTVADRHKQHTRLVRQAEAVTYPPVSTEDRARAAEGLVDLPAREVVGALFRTDRAMSPPANPLRDRSPIGLRNSRADTVLNVLVHQEQQMAAGTKRRPIPRSRSH